jgi:hypothetical protein
MRTWKDNAREFGALSKQGYGVRLALLAACSVDPAARPGQKGRFPAPARENVRVSQEEFAKTAGAAPTTIGQCLKKWDRMVDAGWKVPREKLTPAMSTVLELPDGFVAEYEALTEERPAYRHLSRAGMADAIRSDPETAKAAAAAVLEVPETLVDSATSDQLNQVSEAMLQRTLRDAGMPPAGPRARPGDPRPEWAKQVTRIGLDAHEVTQMVSRLREEGRTDLADSCYRELRHTLLDALTRLESTSIPETPEGVNR